MRRLGSALAALALLASPIAAAPRTHPAVAAPSELPLWPADLALTPPERSEPEDSVTVDKPVAGRPWTYTTNVARPRMAIHRPMARDAHTALLVFPGGGYQGLAVDLEGSEVCDWAVTIGLTCIVVKYRTLQFWHRDPRHEQQPTPFLPLQDAQRAIALVRARAAGLGIDPRKVGVIGFSAGGHLVTALSNAEARSYPAVDAVDQLSLRPDFAIALYPGHLWSGDMAPDRVAIAPWNTISRHAPPTFLLQSMNDPVDPVRNSMFYALKLHDAGVPVELHLFAHGGHAFGARATAEPVTRWPALVETWLRGLKVL